MRGLFAFLFLLLPVLTSAQALKVSPKGATIDVAFTISPASGYCPYNATATWSATNASVCTKSGSWSGAGVLASGSEQIQINSTSATYTLTCSTNTDYRDLSWVNPTQNTDGSAVNLIGNKVFHGPTQVLDTVAPIVLTPAATSYRVTGLPAGTRYFGVKAVGKGGQASTDPATNGVDSLMSNVVSVVINLPSGTKSTTVGCTTPPPPKPPSGVSVN